MSNSKKKQQKRAARKVKRISRSVTRGGVMLDNQGHNYSRTEFDGEGEWVLKLNIPEKGYYLSESAIVYPDDLYYAKRFPDKTSAEAFLFETKIGRKATIMESWQLELATPEHLVTS